jgi:predicted nucleic acid-binding protein
MICVDTNVISALLEADDVHAELAENALLTASKRGKLLICPVVYAEMIAKPKRQITTVDGFLSATRIEVDWNFEKQIWQVAGLGFQTYATMRKKQKLPEPRRILTDFLIGAHALERGFTLLTLDSRVYKTSFPKLNLETLGA